jgi:hypothetical protein
VGEGSTVEGGAIGALIPGVSRPQAASVVALAVRVGPYQEMSALWTT